jgi:hypothetical protein
MNKLYGRTENNIQIDLTFTGYKDWDRLELQKVGFSNYLF